MSNLESNRDFGNLACYAIKELYLESGQKNDFSFDKKSLKAKIANVVKDEHSLQKFKSEFNYSEREVEGVKKIVHNYHQLSILLSKTVKKYEGTGVVPFNADSKITKYKLLPIIGKAIESGDIIGNSQMLSHNNIVHKYENHSKSNNCL